MTSANFNAGIPNENYPASGLVPKAETGVLNFLQKYPEFDGRDVTIAILDSGVDPLASGLQTLCDGKTVKVIERFDCTGCGDVDVSRKVRVDERGFIVGLSGRELKLTPEMISKNNKNGEFRLGLKNLNDLCPLKVREAQCSNSKNKNWDSHHKVAVADLIRKINEFDSQNGDLTKLSCEKKLFKENLENTLEMLNHYDKNYADIKSTFDCVLYSTENGWKAVIDISEEGDLEKAVHIAEYSKTHEIKNVDDYLSISINVHDDGNVLEIIGMCSPHGTHVASIASGNSFCKDIDGVAPNAKIVSLTIGDGRLGSMETGTALVRAMIKVMEMCRSGKKIDVINMSYGEHAHWSNTGRLGELMSEVVNKYGVVWVASAGNHGPALCTVGTPPDISQPCLIGVGAYVSPQMMESEYSMMEKLPANVYTWTSRDPCIDGGQAVTICAPGGAITSVPQFTMSKYQLMNGTSMAAPHVAGAIALLISGLKQKGIAYSPFSIKRAISATANKLSYVDEFAQGNGLLNVVKAFEHLVEYKNQPDTMIRFSVRCGPQSAKGIHIRENVLQKPIDVNVSIQPVFLNEKEVEPEKKFNYNVRLSLICYNTFVQCGAFLDLSYSPRSLMVKVDPSGLQPGVHSAVISAYDSDCIQKGSLFDIPITIVQPIVLKPEKPRIFEPTFNHDGSVEFQPNTIKRHFILVPDRATWAVLHIRSLAKNNEKNVGKFFIHTMQLLPKSSCRSLESMKFLNVGTENDIVWIFKCQGNNILELCIAKYWSNFGSSYIKYHLEFHGIKAVNQNAYMMRSARGVHKIDVSAFIHEEIQPQIQLKSAAVVLKPTEAKISPLSSTRDIIPEGRQIYQNLLTYSLNVPKTQEIALYAPAFNELLYESEFESQLWMIFDSNKVMIACGDAHSHKFYNKFEKGDYVIKMQIRHEKRDLLEKISESNMIAQFKLSSTLTLDIYDHYNNCLIGARKLSNCIVKGDCIKSLYVNTLLNEKLNKANLPNNCAWLIGSITLSKDEWVRKVDFNDFIYILSQADGVKKNGNGNNANTSSSSGKSKTNATPPQTTSSSDASNDAEQAPTNDGGDSQSPKKNKVNAEEYMESFRDFQCSMITKCELNKAEQIYNEVVLAHPKHLIAHLLFLQTIESSELKTMYPFAFTKSIACKTEITEDKPADEVEGMRKSLVRAIQLADIVINGTESESLLAYYGLKYDPRPDAAKIKSSMDKQKNTLLEAYSRKGIALAKISLIEKAENGQINEIKNIYMEVLKFTDATDSKVIQFSLWHAYILKHYGRMYKLLQKLFEEKRTREVLDEICSIANVLNYGHLLVLVKRSKVSAFPSSYRIF